ncbi:MAG: chemotaxis-specific protein-glutamate methyltransferase CheB [Lachnospiraceae bacterium]|nr:chemotaxis-specific protein-glutamate methyltransferase CheB [Lachnospiraceae bacterium]
MPKNILIVDDSALIRSVLSGIINGDPRFRVADRAVDGLEALELIRKKTYDAVVLDINMPRMNGIELLKTLQREKIHAKIMIASTDTKEGAKITMDCLELGAMDFIHKPDNTTECRSDDFTSNFLETLAAVAESKAPDNKVFTINSMKTSTELSRLAEKHSARITGKRIVAIASSTGGPRALQSVIPLLPGKLRAPVVMVQHMPVGFTQSLAERLDNVSELKIKEAAEGDVLEDGCVYLSKGGAHMNIISHHGKSQIHYTDEPSREGVKPCANYMYESLKDSAYDEVICVVMTGMGADGTEGIKNLKAGKKVQVIAQDADTCTVYGMPKSVAAAGLTDVVVPLGEIAQEIILRVGVR